MKRALRHLMQMATHLETEISAERGTVSEEYLKDVSNPNVVCVRYTAPGTEGQDTLIGTVTDGKDKDGKPDVTIDATVRHNFPVVRDEF